MDESMPGRRPAAAAPPQGTDWRAGLRRSIVMLLLFKLVIASATAQAGVILTAGFGLFPFLMPSSTDPRSSLTVRDASASRLTLFIMLIAMVVFMPAVLAYTAWVFHVLRGKITLAHVRSQRGAY